MADLHRAFGASLHLGKRTSHKDALLAEILPEPALARICKDYLDIIRRRLDEPGFRKALAHNLAQLAIAHHLAVSSFFWLSPTLGAWYYAIFPASASAGLIIASVGTVMAALAVVSALAGVVVDPILAVTGVHRRRLEKFIDRLGDELRGYGESRLKIHDHYLARVFDLLDLLKAAAQAAM